jgi:asparagine synthase (glutamine-hydrolysing)
MCGICGIFEYGTNHTVAPELLTRMRETLRHRGPDDAGCYIAPGVGLATRRLSIIDVAGGQQPICNEDESIWIVFNGEIYNYQELREEVIKKGHRLRTRSDTEVILHLYEEYGPGCVQHLDGMFAFAIYDQRPQRSAKGSNSKSGRLVIARDRLGKKPLYFADLGDALIFGSEIKPILQDPRVGKDLDFEALHHYLSLQVIPAPYSIFKAIRKLPAGYLLECDADGARISQYWDYLKLVDNHHASEQEAVAEVRRLLFDAVEKRLIAEVPLGAFLSGGLDSSAVVAIMSRIKQQPVDTFSIGFQGPSTHNELPYARILAKHCNTRHHEFLVSPDIIETVNEIVHYADEPLGISAAIPTFLISKAAREHVTVVLTGDGGDEVFMGYGQYIYEEWAERYRRLPIAVDRVLTAPARMLSVRIDNPVGRWSNRIARFASNARRSLGQRRLGWASGFSEIEKRLLYSSAASANFSFESTASFIEGKIQTKGIHRSALQQNCMDILIWLPDEMMAKVDRMTMAASVEARCPFLDWKLVEYLAGLSIDVKVPGSRSMNLKHLLRQAVSDLVPIDLLRRPKRGFNVPLDAWFRGRAGEYLESVLSPQRVRRRGLFNPNEVTSLLKRHQAGQINASNRLYTLLIFEVWAETYL